MAAAIGKLLRKELRQLDLPQELFLIDTESVEVRVLQELLAEIFQGRVTVTLLPKGTRRRRDVFLPTSLENELCRELRAFLEGEERPPRHPPLLATVPEKLLLAYAKRRKLPGKPLAPTDDIRELLETLQQGQAQTKASFRKSFEHLRKISGKEGQRI